MRGRVALIFIAVSVFLFRSAAGRAAADCGKPCREHPGLSGRCFTVRGRMAFHNGAPSVRIWRVGTRRILGVSEQRFQIDGYCNLPPSVRERVSWETDLFADFVVCPFTRDEPGVMRLVCVDSATNTVVRPRRPVPDR